MRGVRDGETERRVQDIVMRYKYNVRELKDTEDGDIADVGTVQVMEAMSFKKLKAKLDHKKKYFVEYKNKRDNFVSVVTSGKEPK
tara:strand:+ start:203 stop:457 length:255 start_codon:yes stop_codon:yes gene_type:complete